MKKLNHFQVHPNKKRKKIPPLKYGMSNKELDRLIELYKDVRANCYFFP